MAALNVTVARYATMGSNHGSDNDDNDHNRSSSLILPIHGDSVERVVARGRYAVACFSGQHSPIAVWAANAEVAECAETVAATAAASETSTAITPTVVGRVHSG